MRRAPPTAPWSARPAPPVRSRRARKPAASTGARKQGPRHCVGTASSDLEQELLQDGLLEVVETDRLDDDVALAADHVIAIIDVEPFGRLRRKDVFGRLH